jgi:hypothetical protein
MTVVSVVLDTACWPAALLFVVVVAAAIAITADYLRYRRHAFLPYAPLVGHAAAMLRVIATTSLTLYTERRIRELGYPATGLA